MRFRPPHCVRVAARWSLLRLMPCLALLMAGLLTAPVWADEANPDKETPRAAGQRMLREGDRLAEAGKYDDASLRYKDAMVQLLPGMRKLDFKREVAGVLTPRDELRGVLLKLVDDEMPPEKIREASLGLKALGLMPPDMDYKQIMLKMLTEEVAGFYDSKSKEMHLIKEPPVDPKNKPGFLGQLLGSKSKGFAPDETKAVLAHEMTHALADQHFDLEKLQKAAEKNGDRELALSALIEGEAMLTMMAAAQEDWDGTMIVDLPAGRLNLIMGLFAPLMTRSAGPAFKEAPPILSETLIFPYLKGLVFCARLTNKGGWAELDEAYVRPPLSTEQVLHPDKYLGDADGNGIDRPTIITLGDLPVGDAWKPVTSDTLGELAISIMLKAYNGRAAAAGWGGDRFAVFESKDDRLGLVWMTTWDTEQDAREFARNYARFQTAKFAARAGGDDAVPPPDAFTDLVQRNVNGAALAIELRAKDVAIVEGFNPPTTTRLLNTTALLPFRRVALP